MSVRSQKVEDTRTRLLDAGLSALIGHGYHGTGLKAVLDSVGVPKGSFYNYFQSKEHFGAEVIRHYAGRMFEQMDAALNRPQEDALSTLNGYFQDVIRCFESERPGCLVGNLGAELGDCSEPCRQAMAEAMGGVKERFQRVLALGQDQGSVRKDIPAQELADFLVSAWQGALIRMKVEASLDPLRQFIDLVLDQMVKART
ncbi:MAG: TetR family transcriptional regulator C-terminal domain-containing protein [Phycisphaerae bacterium]